ncbi:glycoside hydrolase domain-containing protein [Streptomyces mayteni]
MYAGFDRMTPPGLDSGDGDALMRGVLANTNLRWAGFYLGHAATQETDTEWTKPRNRTPNVASWRYYRSEGWGLAPLVLARQFLGTLPNTHPNPEWTAANGTADGQRHVRRAVAAEIETGATIYLDLELGGFMSTTHFPDYLRAWRDAVAAAGYRPGVYCWPVDVPLVAHHSPTIALWVVDPGKTQPHVYDEATGRLALPPAPRWTDPTEGDWVRPGSIAFQFAWYNENRTDDAGNVVSTSQLPLPSGVKRPVFRIDYDASRVPDPAHPEDPGALAMAAFPPGGPALFAVSPADVFWTRFDGAWDSGAGEDGTPSSVGVRDLGYGPWFDTASAAAVSRRPEHIDLFGVGVDGSVWTSWESPTESSVDHPWTLNPTMPARPRSPIAAVSRRPDQLDVFFINTSHEIVTTWWNPNDTDWAVHTGPITHGFAMAPGTDLTAVTTPGDPDSIDVFAVDAADLPRWVRWKPATGWTTETVPNVVNVDPRLGVRAAHHGGRLHLLVPGRDGSVSHLLRGAPDHGSPDAWSLAFAIPQPPSTSRPVALRLLSVGDLLVAIAITARAELVWTAWNGISWTLPGVDVGGVPYSTCGRLAAVRVDDQTVDIALPNGNRKLMVRRLRRDPFNPVMPFSATTSWETVLA